MNIYRTALMLLDKTHYYVTDDGCDVIMTIGDLQYVAVHEEVATVDDIKAARLTMLEAHLKQQEEGYE